MADGGKTGSAPRYVNNLNNTDVHKGAIILQSSKETPHDTEKGCISAHSKGSSKTKENQRQFSHPLCTLNFKGSLE